MGRGDARALREDLLERTEAVYGPRHPQTIRSVLSLSATLMNQRDNAAAEATLLQGLRRCEDLPVDHEVVLTVRLRLAVAQNELGRRAEALSAVDDVIRICRAAEEPSTARIFEAESLRAQLLVRSESWEEAEAQCRQALATASGGGVPDLRLGWVHMFHGKSLRNLERYDEAVASLERAEGLLRVVAPADRYLGVTCQELAGTYEAWGKPDEAAAWRRVAAEWAETRAAESAEH